MIWAILAIGLVGGLSVIANAWIYKNTFADTSTVAPYRNFTFFKQFESDLGLSNSDPDSNSERD